MAEGANDDGSGVAAVLEATRILNSLGLKPLRTIRFVFFSGEEEGLLGFRAYVLAHKRELDHLSAAPHGFRFQGRIDLKNSMEKLLLIWRGKPLVVQNHTSVCRLRG